MTDAAMPPDVALLPCPFCGAQAKNIGYSFGVEYAQCTDCGISVGGIERWNRRAANAALAARCVDGLTFAELRRANIARLPQFKNKRGEQAHSQPDGSDWSDSDWLQAVVGELGEYANLKKKVLRGDLSREEAQSELADELADVATYLDILAFRLGIDLGAAIADKFNRVSERVGSTVRIRALASSPSAETRGPDES